MSDHVLVKREDVETVLEHSTEKIGSLEARHRLRQALKANPTATEKDSKDSATPVPSVQAGGGKPESSGESAIKLLANLVNAHTQPLAPEAKQERINAAVKAADEYLATMITVHCCGCGHTYETSKRSFLLPLHCPKCAATPAPSGESVAPRCENERCVYCRNWYPKPVSLHHSEDDCDAPSGDVSVAGEVVTLQTTRAGYHRLMRANVEDLNGVDRVSRELIDSGEMTAADSPNSVRLEGELRTYAGDPVLIHAGKSEVFELRTDRPVGENFDEMAALFGKRVRITITPREGGGSDG